MKQLTPYNFEQALGTELGSTLAASVNRSNLCYRDVTREEHIAALLYVLKSIDSPAAIAGPHRLQDWENGWSQNLANISRGNLRDAITPKYYGKHSISRWNQSFIRPIDRSFDAKVVGIITEWCFDQYIRDVDAFYEFGCGPGHNLMTARSYNPTAEIWGCDWAASSQQIVDAVAYRTSDAKMFSKKFDFFNIDNSFVLRADAAVFTLASLEQTHTNYVDFIRYIINSKPRVCIHIEPIAELLDANNLLDYLSISYFEKRKYLKGFLTFLKEMERAGTIEIIRGQRTYTGSFMIEGHSVIVWRPIYT